MMARAVPRRAMLKATGLAALGAGVSACAARGAGSLVWPEPPRRYARVHVSEDRVIRTVVGLRPYRPSGFVVRAEKVGDKSKDAASETGEAITDAWITTKLKADFVDEDTLKGSDINVDTNNHVVTLKGTVASAAGKARAAAIAKSTKGVKSVVNTLTIGPKK